MKKQRVLPFTIGLLGFLLLSYSLVSLGNTIEYRLSELLLKYGILNDASSLTHATSFIAKDIYWLFVAAVSGAAMVSWAVTRLYSLIAAHNVKVTAGK